jgi:addiction module HigA family antidote
MYELEYFYEA